MPDPSSGKDGVYRMLTFFHELLFLHLMNINTYLLPALAIHPASVWAFRPQGKNVDANICLHGITSSGKVRSGRRGWACGIRISAPAEQAGRQRSRRDDGVCLTTLRARRAGPVKGGVRRQAPSRLRERLKSVIPQGRPAARQPSLAFLCLCQYYLLYLHNIICHFTEISVFLILYYGIQA